MKERLRTTCLLLAAMAAGYIGGLMSQASTIAAVMKKQPVVSDVVKAKSFALLDSKGNVRGMFTTLKENPALALFDKEGNARGVFSTSKEGDASLSLINAKGKNEGEFSTSKEGSYLCLSDSEGNSREELRLNNGKGDPGFYMRDAEGLIHAMLATTAGQCMFILFDAQGTQRQMFSTLANKPFFTMFDRNGKPRGEFSVDNDGVANYFLYNADGNITWSAHPSYKP